MSFRQPDPQAPLGSDLRPIHQSDYAPIMGGPDYTPPGGGVWAKTVGGTAFHNRMADVCNGAQRRPALYYVDEALKREQKVAWGRYTPESLAMWVEECCVATDNVFRPRREDGWVAEICFRYQDPETGYWYEGTIDLLNLSFDGGRIKSASIIDYKTGEALPDLRLGPQHHEYSLAVKYGVLDHVPYFEDTRLLDWSKMTALPLIPRKWPKEFRFLHVPALLKRGSWFALGMGSDGDPMTEADSLATMRALTKRLLENQPTRLAVAIPAEPSQPEPQVMGNPQTTAANPFKKATKAAAKLRLALIGPSGSGKTYTALKIATALGKRVAVIDTERGSAAKYADEFSFDVVELERFEPRAYCDLIVAGAEQYDVIVIDSLSHAWAGPGGVLEFVDAKNGNGGSNKFAAWRDATPMHNELVNTILAAKCHIIATMRSKMEYVQEKDERGKVTIRKVGMQPVQREGMEYEFDVIGDLDAATMTVSKTRCKALHDRRFVQPGADVAKLLSEWLGASTVAPAPEQHAAPQMLPTIPGKTETFPQNQPANAEQLKHANSGGLIGSQFTWGEPRGEGFASDAQLKRIKANCDALGFGPKKVLLTAYSLGTDKNATTVADVTEKIATQLVLKLDALLKATDTPRPDRAPTAEEVLNEEIHKIIGDEIRTKNAKALRDLMTAGSLTPAEVIDTMVNEIGPDPLVFNSLAAPTQEQLLEILKRQANAKAERQLVATGAANGNGNH